MIREIFSRTGSAGIAAQNAIWLSGSKLATLLLNLIVVVFVSRHLGPSGFGLFSYAIAVASILGTAGNLGLNSLVTRELVRRKRDREVIIGTSLLLRFLGSCATAAMGMYLVYWLRPDEIRLAWFVGLLLGSEAFRAGVVFSFWFEAQAQAASIGVAQLVVTLLGASLKIGLVLVDASLSALVIAQALDGLLVLVVFGGLYRLKVASPVQISVSSREGKALLSQSFPLIISGLTAVIYFKIDQVMLGQIAGNEVVGIYAVAARMSEAWYFVPTAIATAVFPFLLRLRESNVPQYEKRLQDLFDLLTWMGLIVATTLSLAGPTIIEAVFGTAFSSAGILLAIHAWGGVFMAPRALVSKWLLAENALVYSLVSQGGGALVNVLLNLLMIPVYGAMGAAFATVIAYCCSGYLVFFLFDRTRPVAFMMSRSAIAPFRLLDRSWFS